MITVHALMPEMSAINRIVNGAMTAIHNEQVQRVGHDSSSDDDDISYRRRSTNLYREWSNILADHLDTVGGTLKSCCRLHHQSQNIVCRSKEPAECLLKYHNDVGL